MGLNLSTSYLPTLWSRGVSVHHTWLKLQKECRVPPPPFSCQRHHIRLALVAAHVPSHLEPSCLYRSDGKRPDGVSTVLWKCGQLLVSDATCPDSIALSYSTIAAKQVGAVAQQAQEKKMQKYKHLDSCHFFTPVAIETTGVFGPRTTEFLKELGHRLRQVTGEAKSFAYLTRDYQLLSNGAMQLPCWGQ